MKQMYDDYDEIKSKVDYESKRAILEAELRKATEKNDEIKRDETILALANLINAFRNWLEYREFMSEDSEHLQEITNEMLWEAQQEEVLHLAR